MSTTLSRRTRTVSVRHLGRVEVEAEFATLREAQADADRQIADALHVAHVDSPSSVEIFLGARGWHVLGHSSGHVSVREIDGRLWTQGERIACLQRHFGKSETEFIRGALA